MPGSIKQTDMINGLTPKQETFAQGVFAGNGLTASYRNAYSIKPDTKDCSVHQNACRLMANVKVISRVD